MLRRQMVKAMGNDVKRAECCRLGCCLLNHLKKKVSANVWTRFSRLSIGHKIKPTSTPAVPFVRK